MKKKRELIDALCQRDEISALRVLENCVAGKMNKLDCEGLFLAAEFGYEKVALELIKKGGSPSMRDVDGLTPLHFANTAGVAACLVEGGADVNAISKDGVTPVARAASNGRIEVVDFLCHKGADLNIQDKLGLTALHNAARKSPGIVNSLLRHGAKPYLRDCDGRSAVFRAVFGKNYESIRTLIDFKVDLNLADNDGAVPLMYAIGKRDFEMVSLFHEFSADFSVVTKSGRSVLDFAEESGDQGLILFVKRVLDKEA